MLNENEIKIITSNERKLRITLMKSCIGTIKSLLTPNNRFINGKIFRRILGTGVLDLIGSPS